MVQIRLIAFFELEIFDLLGVRGKQIYSCNRNEMIGDDIKGGPFGAFKEGFHVDLALLSNS